jgi:branched-chain amino acid aminotransferase
MSVYETPLGPAVFRMPEHVVRLLHSAELVGLPLTLDARAIEAGILETVRANPGATAVKVSAYLPSIEVDVVPLDPHVAVAIAAYDPQADVNAGKPTQPHKPSTLKIWIEKSVKNRREDIVPPQAKVSGNYTSPMQAKWNARRAGYDEILLVDEDGYVAEGPTTNVFLVDANGVLATPPIEKVLHGVTRSSILALAAAEGLSSQERKITPEALASSDEVFLTGTTAGVWPVESVDGVRIRGGAPGPVSERLAKRFRAVTRGEDPAFAHWLTPVKAS